MPDINISEETLTKLKAFSKVIDYILEENLGSDSDYAELVLSVGLERMLQDILPKEETLLKTMALMFKKNSEFVSQFVVDTLKEGESAEGKNAKDKWSPYM